MDLFPEHSTEPVAIAAGAYWLPGFALPVMPTLWQTLQQHLTAHPAQQMMTPMGLMSVATSSMGHWGWVGSSQGYGYLAYDPVTGQPWPAIPPVILKLAANAAAQAGYCDFVPDNCLINIYQAGSKMGLHQDKDEQDFSHPIVSVSIGIPATFMFGGAKRNDKPSRLPLQHGDVVIWGGESRRFYHGVAAIGAHQHPLTGNKRINLTLRKAK